MKQQHRPTKKNRPSHGGVSCKICGAASVAWGSVDFNKNCEARRGLDLAPSGILVKYHKCVQCSFIFTTAFDSWSEADFKRDIYNADYLRVDPDYELVRPLGSASLVDELFAEKKSTLDVLDYGGGNGVMAEELLSRGFASSHTYDPFTERYAQVPKTRFDLVCCFETLEHVPDPLATIGQICKLVTTGGMVVFSTLVQPEPVDLDWWYLAPRNGHISIFSKDALATAWAAHGFKLVSWNANIHAAFREVPVFAPQAVKTAMGSQETAPEMVTAPMPMAGTPEPMAGGFNELAACRSGIMLFNKNDQYVGASLRKYGECSIGETKLFELIVLPGSTVLEVGANIGMHTIGLSRQVGPAGTVHAFEPQRIVFQALCANLALNSCPNVFSHQAAVGSVGGSLLVPWLDPATPANFGGLSLLGAKAGETVPMLTVDGLELGACHLIKVDVEGMEAEVLRGAAGTIGRFRPLLYVENDRDEGSAELIALIQSYDYRLYWHVPALYNAENFRGDPENIFSQLVSVNMLCVPVEVPQTLTMFREVSSPTDTWH